MNIKLPKPAHKYGYTQKQLNEIIKQAGVGKNEFNDAFGVNTCAVDEKLGTIYYKQDIERALYKLGLGGKFHEWD